MPRIFQHKIFNIFPSRLGNGIHIYTTILPIIYYFRWCDSWRHLVINICTTILTNNINFRWCDSWRHLGINIYTTILPIIYYFRWCDSWRHLGIIISITIILIINLDDVIAGAALGSIFALLAYQQFTPAYTNQRNKAHYFVNIIVHWNIICF